MWGVAIGLFVGKPVGVLLGVWLAIKSNLATLPANSTWGQIVGVAVLCGIGFTMSLFVANLAFPGQTELLTATKVGILGASLLAGLIGGGLIAWTAKGSSVKNEGRQLAPARSEMQPLNPRLADQIAKS